jgi:hypothetical protein
VDRRLDAIGVRALLVGKPRLELGACGRGAGEVVRGQARGECALVGRLRAGRAGIAATAVLRGRGECPLAGGQRVVERLRRARLLLLTEPALEVRGGGRRVDPVAAQAGDHLLVVGSRSAALRRAGVDRRLDAIGVRALLVGKPRLELGAGGRGAGEAVRGQARGECALVGRLRAGRAGIADRGERHHRARHYRRGGCRQ